MRIDLCAWADWLQSLANRAALRSLHAQLLSTQSDLERTHGDLKRAEKRADRLGSKTVAEVEPKKTAKSSAQPTPSDTPERRPSPPPVTPVAPFAINRDELSAVQQLAASRLIELDNLRAARLHLEHQLDDLRVRVR